MKKIVTVLNVDKNVGCALDTIDSIKTCVGDDILVVVDGVYWNLWQEIPVAKINGFKHGCPKSPYRNVALGLKAASEMWNGKFDWLCYCEYDVLFASSRFIYNLKMAEQMGVWMLGNDGRIDGIAMPLVQAVIGEPLHKSYYLIGCCQFFHRDFIEKLKSIDFFDKFLSLTNSFTDGFFPFYSGYDLSEHLYPTLARHFGGNIGVFANYESENGKWHGAYQYYPVRWRPELDPETENFPHASILHPLKEVSHPIRIFHKERRIQCKEQKERERQSALSSIYPSDTPKVEELSTL